MPFSPARLISRYQRDAVPSYSQFDYLYCYVHGGYGGKKWSQHKIRQGAVWLALFLAHWGMFRASGKLRDKDIVFFEGLFDSCLLGNQPLLGPLIQTPFERLSDLSPADIDGSLKGLRDYLWDAEVSPTDTLVSKIILGLCGNVPGYDTRVKAGLERLQEADGYDGFRSFSGRGLIQLVAFFEERRHFWPSPSCTGDTVCPCPRGRLVDMALFVYGS